MKVNEWIPIDEQLPEVDEDGYSNYILLSFDNFSVPCIGMYRVEEDGSAAFYEGDDEWSLVSYGLIVNAWMPLPECYREDEK